MNNYETVVYRLRKRAEIRRQAKDRLSVQEGKPDKISDLLEESARHILNLEKEISRLEVLLSDNNIEYWVEGE